jgi:hypothetical protein
MLEMVAQYHQVVDDAVFGVFGFPIEHLVKMIFAGCVIGQRRVAFGAMVRRLGHGNQYLYKKTAGNL